MSRWAVILAGGVGSRFWPLSTPRRPKQLLPLVTHAPLLVDTMTRMAPLATAEHTLVLTGESLTAAVRSLLRGLPAGNVIGEPRAAGTAPALAWAAAQIARRDSPDAVMLSVHADWAIGDDDAFRATLERAAEVAVRQRALVTVGIAPTRPDPGFGYIEPGEPVDGARRVKTFREKPDRAIAERMIRDGYLWNSGIFVWRVGDFLDEVRAHARELDPGLPFLERGERERFFTAVQPVAVDHAVLERSSRVLVLAATFPWDDVGTWAALRRVRAKDALGNASAGRVHPVDARGNVVHAAGPDVVLYGVNDLVVVALDGLTVVTTLDRAADLKALLDALPAEVRERS
ncbi:MAG TPA: sugar phosphate nucleotidyltransferase [Gemmatimonadaceae bacterium]|nr:sugar phosphate nucleotidyltransferase [Gemmatimonadaceae bacterium]